MPTPSLETPSWTGALSPLQQQCSTKDSFSFLCDIISAIISNLRANISKNAHSANPSGGSSCLLLSTCHRKRAAVAAPPACCFAFRTTSRIKASYRRRRWPAQHVDAARHRRIHTQFTASQHDNAFDCWMQRPRRHQIPHTEVSKNNIGRRATPACFLFPRCASL